MTFRIASAIVRPSSGDRAVDLANAFLRGAFGLMVLVFHGWHKTVDGFANHLAASHIDLAFDADLAPAGASPLGRPVDVNGVSVGNRFAILPMEGWDGTTDGQPTG